MTADPPFGDDVLRELQFALAEADAEAPGPELLARVRAAALSARSAGRPSVAVESLSGLETFRRATVALDALLSDLDPSAWTRLALRGLDVQGLVGHLIGVESAFVASLDGDVEAGVAEHVASTQADALAQAGRPTVETLAEWRTAVARSIERAGALAAAGSVTYYGITLPLDDLLVVRAFELWIHEEDIRRATGLGLGPPDAGRLARMTSLAMTLLPAGVASIDRARQGESIRLVLTGAGGGTWDVALGGDGGAGPRPRPGARVVVDAAAFCRVVGNRADLESAGALVTGDVAMAADVFAGAAALALD